MQKSKLLLYDIKVETTSYSLTLKIKNQKLGLYTNEKKRK
jgi:hypothetical protein